MSEVTSRFQQHDKNIPMTRSKLKRWREDTNPSNIQNREEQLSENPILAVDLNISNNSKVSELMDGNTQLAEVAAVTEDMIADLQSPDVGIQLSAVRKFRKFLSHAVSEIPILDAPYHPQPSVEQVINTGVVPKFVEFLSHADNLCLQHETVWVLTNLACGSVAQTLVIVEAGAVPCLIKLFDSPNKDMRNQAVWALMNIAHDCRDYVLSCGIVEPLLMLQKSCTDLSMIEIFDIAFDNLGLKPSSA